MVNLFLLWSHLLHKQQKLFQELLKVILLVWVLLLMLTIGILKSLSNLLQRTAGLSLASVRQELKYQSGLDRKWTRESRFDFYRPIFANLGEQAIRNDELHFSTNTTTNLATYGYQQAWSEYRYSTSKIVGQLRSNYTQSLDVWHLAQEFTTTPTLSAAFIEENPPMDRVVALPSEPDFTGEFELNFYAARAMPMLPIPGLTKL